MNFSCLLSLYNKEKPENFSQAMQSIWVQQFLKPNEVVLVLDGSLTEKLYEEIDFWSGLMGDILKVIPLETNQGLGKALNYGISFCSYEYIARMDTDDISTPDRFEKQINFLKRNPDVDLLGGQIAEFEKEVGDLKLKRELPTAHKEIVVFSKFRCPFNHPAVIYRKSSVIEAGGYQDDYLYEDYALWIRMIHGGAKTANLPDVILNMRSGEAMFHRRGGLKYAKSEIKAQLNFYTMGFITFFQLIRNICVRLPVRIAPNRMRSFFYKKILRNEIN